MMLMSSCILKVNEEQRIWKEGTLSDHLMLRDNEHVERTMFDKVSSKLWVLSQGY
jgi:hypothetical protein